jgi:hypothetical protein
MVGPPDKQALETKPLGLGPRNVVVKQVGVDMPPRLGVQVATLAAVFESLRA